jgi:hypothetical protein
LPRLLNDCPVRIFRILSGDLVGTICLLCIEQGVKPMQARLDENIRDIEERILPKLRGQLEILESGKVPLHMREGNGPWIDPIGGSEQRLRRTIAEYEAIVAKLRADVAI